VHAFRNASQYLIERVPRWRLEELVRIDHEYEIRRARAQDLAREWRQDLRLKKSDALVAGDLNGQAFLDQRRQDLGGAIERSVVDDRKMIYDREVVADECLDDVRFVADDGFGAQPHGGPSKSARRGRRRVGFLRF